MGVEFRLILAGDPAVDEIAALTAAHPDETPRPTTNPRLFTARLYDQRGYAITVRAGTHGYYEAETDSGARWEWEPDTYVNITFSPHADDLTDKAIPNMIATVSRVLAGRHEEAALIQDGNRLLLNRTNGVLRLHHRTDWWDHYHLTHLITG